MGNGVALGAAGRYLGVPKRCTVTQLTGETLLIGINSLVTEIECVAGRRSKNK